MKKEELQILIKEEKSIYKIAKRINKVPNTVNYWLKKFELEKFYKAESNYGKSLFKLNSFIKEELELAVKDSQHLGECLDKLGVKKQARNLNNLNKILQNFNINTKHFNGKEIRIDKLLNSVKNKELSLDIVLVKDSSYSRSSLKKKLYKYGLKKRICEMCEQGEEWKGKNISLILDHINGVYNDNRIENLRILCPNCNATLDTHCGKNNKNK